MKALWQIGIQRAKDQRRAKAQPSGLPANCFCPQVKGKAITMHGCTSCLKGCLSKAELLFSWHLLIGLRGVFIAALRIFHCGAA